MSARAWAARAGGAGLARLWPCGRLCAPGLNDVASVGRHLPSFLVPRNDVDYKGFVDLHDACIRGPTCRYERTQVLVVVHGRV